MRVISLAVALLAFVVVPTTTTAQSVPDTRATWKIQPRPEQVSNAYPKAALTAGISGKAVVVCTVNVAGSAKNCRVKSEQPTDYDFGVTAAAIIETYGQFYPATRNGQPVASEINIPMNFTAERTFEQALEIKKNEEKAERYRKQKEEKAERDRQQEQTNARLAAQATETWKASIQGMGQFGPISSDDGRALAFFTSPISRNGSKIRIWERDELEYQMLGYSSSYELTEIDCAINTHRTVQITTYGENNLLGAVLYTGRGKALSEYIAPNTIIDAISKSACKMHLSRKRHH